jgi:hypothetical protein
MTLNRSGLGVLGCGLLVLTGCSVGSSGGFQTAAVQTVVQAVATTPKAGTKPGAGISGTVHGGQSPIVGGNVYLFAANTTTYGDASVSLLTSSTGNPQDASGGPTNGDYYVITGGDGSFHISGDYSCTPNSQVYVYVLGGDTGSGNNPSVGLIAALGNCPVAGNFMGTTPFLAVNEVSTVAAAYAIAGFAVDATHVSSSGTPLAQVGIANAFANAANLATLGTGVALTATPAGNGTVPQTEINTLANILAYCINTDGTFSGPSSPSNCYSLLTTATSDGTGGGVQPTETATAAINIAHHPGANVASLFLLQEPTPPFPLDLSLQPNDFTIALTFPAGLNLPNMVAIDGAGNAWITSQDPTSTSVIEILSAGAATPGTNGYTGGGALAGPWGVAIDLSGNAWVTNTTGNNVTELSSLGSSEGSFTAATMSGPSGIAIDGLGDAWITNGVNSTVSELSSAGADSSGLAGFLSSDLNIPDAIAIDGTGNAWVANSSGISVTEFTGAGVVQSGGTGFTGGGIYGPTSIAIDSFDNVWVASPYSDSGLDPGGVTELSHAGAPMSNPTGGGLQNPSAIAIDGADNVWVGDSASKVIEFSNAGALLSGAAGYLTPTVSSIANGVAIDGSGNVWIVFTQSNAVAELVGAGVPVVTPLAVGALNNTLGTQP